MADRNRYNRRGRHRVERDDRNWRGQEEQFSNERGMQPEYEEGQGYQMSEPARGSHAQRHGDDETGWDRNTRYGQRGSGFAGGRSEYISSGEYNYGPAHFDQPGYRFDSFTSEDRAGVTSPLRRQGISAHAATAVTAPVRRTGLPAIMARIATAATGGTGRATRS